LASRGADLDGERVVSCEKAKPDETAEARRGRALAAWQETLDAAFASAAKAASESLSASANKAGASGATEAADGRDSSHHKTRRGPAAVELSAPATLREAVLRGDRDQMPACIDAVIAEGYAPERIVEELLTPILQRLGEDFGAGRAFLPQMMMAGGAMKSAVEWIRHRLPVQAKGDTAGRVLFCTVKGDAHSIGKDICVTLLESQGFEVIDLGVDVTAEQVLATARDQEVDVICLSALMTTTLPNMRETVEAIYRELPHFAHDAHRAVAVGGAVVSDRWAREIGARYAPDAPSCVALIQSICRR
jgi:methanogenic corrinoid protein MtbC1